MKTFFALCIFCSIQVFGQETKPTLTHLKTYSPEEWNKWYFDDYDLTTVETGNWNKWKCEIWGMQMIVETAVANNWQSWKIGPKGGACTLVKKNKYNSWTLVSDAKTYQFVSATKDLSSWTMTGSGTLKAYIFAPGDWDHWVIEGDLPGVNNPEAVVACLFIPVFSGTIRAVHKLK